MKPDRDEIIKLIEDASDLDVAWENVAGRYVRCPRQKWDDQCSAVSHGIHYARNEGGGHGHWQPFDAPHCRLVVRLPAEPGQADPW